MGKHDSGVADLVILACRYRLMERLGRGGMAEVWSAEDLALARPVAIKLLDMPAMPDGLWREARDAGRLVHPNVVQVFDAGSDGDRLFLVMELVAGPDLAELLRERGPLPPPRVARIGAQAARALAAAHAAGLVHRDVKPGNLLQAADGTIKLTDFGIAGPLTPWPATGSTGSWAAGTAGGAASERSEALLGTAAYVAPERVWGGPASPASDLYALGCVLYELLTGRPPFTGEAVADVLQQHMHRPPLSPSRLRPEIPPELEQAVLRLLAKDPAERPGDAALVATVLERIGSTAPRTTPDNATQVLPTLDPSLIAHQSNSPSTRRLDQYPAASPPGPPPVAAWLGQRPLLAATLAAIVLIAVVTAIVTVRESGRAPSAAPPRPSSTATGPSASAPARGTGSAAASPRPTRSEPSSAPAVTAAGLLQALRLRLDQQTAAGRLHPGTANKVGKHLQDTADKLAEGKPGEAAGKITEIRGKLTEAADQGRWTPDPLTLRLLDQLARTL